MIVLVGREEELRLVPLDEGWHVVGVVRVLHVTDGSLLVRECQRTGRANILVQLPAIEVDQLQKCGNEKK